MTILKIEDPRNLITASRLDVFSKIDFVRGYLDGYQTSWSKDIYKAYLNSTKPLAGFNENGTKFSIEDYEREYIQLIESCREFGFNSAISRILVSKGGVVNGAHRLAVSICLGLKLEAEISQQEDQIYDFRYLNRIGIPSIYKKQMCWHLLSYRNDARAFVLSDLSESIERKIISAIDEFADIVTIEKINLTKIGQRRLMELVYGHNTWWKPQFRESMVVERFTRDDAHCSVVFFIGSDLSRLNEFKKTLRKLLGSDFFERQIHGTDVFADTISLAEIMLNENGRHFINNAPIDSESRILSLLGGQIQRDEADGLLIPWAIDGSSVLEIYGIREARDLDYIAKEDDNLPESIKSIGDNHRTEFIKYPLSEYDVISDPRLHFRFKGFKFMSLSSLMFVKSNLLDQKALKDLTAMTNFYVLGGPLYSNSEIGGKAKLWRIELRLNQLFLNSIKFLPSKYQIYLKKLASRIRKVLTNWIRR